MKAFVAVRPSNLSKAVHRIADALAKYAPPVVEIVPEKADADLAVLYAIGFPEIAEWMDEADANGQRAVIAQLCLRTSQRASTADWLPLWKRAALVFSYYDLPTLTEEDGEAWRGVNFLHSPLGVDGDVFKPSGRAKDFVIGTSGYVAETEGVKECAEAARTVGRRMFHLGPDLHVGDNVKAREGLTDAQLAEYWSRCSYVAGLRRTEGFELPAVEAIACGSRPVMFDRPHYRKWFNGHADFIPEGSEREVTAALVDLFRSEPRPVGDEERQAVLWKFSWESIVSSFWTRVLAEESQRRVA